MKVTLDKEGKNVVRVGVELEAEKASRAYEITCRELSQQVEIPGFRKGKAPRNIIEKRFGRELIKKEALEKLIPELLQQVIVDKNLDIITNPEIEDFKFELGEPFTLTAKFEVRPDVKLGLYRGVKVDVRQAVLQEGAVDRALQGLAEQKASLSPIEGREAQLGDHVLLDFECLVDNQPVEGGRAEGLTLEVKEGQFLPGFCDQLVGKKPGDKFEVNVTFPEEYRNKNLAGKPAVFKVDLKELRQRVVPDINDELAEVYGHESLDALTATIKERLDEEVDMENHARAQKHVVEAVVAQAEVDIPETMIQREHELLMQQVKHDVERVGQVFDEFKKNEQFEEIESSKKEEARQRVLHSLVLGAVVREESIGALEEEVLHYLAQIAVENKIPPEKYHEMRQDEYLMRQVTEELLTNKVVNFLVDSAELNYVKDDHEHSPECEHGDDEPWRFKPTAKKGEGKSKESVQPREPEPEAKSEDELAHANSVESGEGSKKMSKKEDE